jgi:capsular polysaccharide biosynthesis protein
MTQELNRELVLIAIVAVVAVVGVVGITKITVAPNYLEHGNMSSDNIAGGAFNKCVYYQNQFDRYNELAMNNPSYQEMADTYDQLITLYCVQ